MSGTLEDESTFITGTANTKAELEAGSDELALAVVRDGWQPTLLARLRWLWANLIRD
jgi:hypothetical protein